MLRALSCRLPGSLACAWDGATRILLAPGPASHALRGAMATVHDIQDVHTNTSLSNGLYGHTRHYSTVSMSTSATVSTYIPLVGGRIPATLANPTPTTPRRYSQGNNVPYHQFSTATIRKGTTKPVRHNPQQAKAPPSSSPVAPADLALAREKLARFQDRLQDKARVTESEYDNALKLCLDLGAVNKAWKIFNTAKKRGITPTTRMYLNLFNVFGNGTASGPKWVDTATTLMTDSIMGTPALNTRVLNGYLRLCLRTGQGASAVPVAELIYGTAESPHRTPTAPDPDRLTGVYIAACHPDPLAGLMMMFNLHDLYDKPLGADDITYLLAMASRYAAARSSSGSSSSSSSSSNNGKVGVNAPATTRSSDYSSNPAASQSDPMSTQHGERHLALLARSVMEGMQARNITPTTKLLAHLTVLAAQSPSADEAIAGLSLLQAWGMEHGVAMDLHGANSVLHSASQGRVSIAVMKMLYSAQVRPNRHSFKLALRNMHDQPADAQLLWRMYINASGPKDPAILTMYLAFLTDLYRSRGPLAFLRAGGGYAAPHGGLTAADMAWNVMQHLTRTKPRIVLTPKMRRQLHHLLKAHPDFQGKARRLFNTHDALRVHTDTGGRHPEVSSTRTAGASRSGTRPGPMTTGGRGDSASSVGSAHIQDAKTG